MDHRDGFLSSQGESQVTLAAQSRGTAPEGLYMAVPCARAFKGCARQTQLKTSLLSQLLSLYYHIITTKKGVGNQKPLITHLTRFKKRVNLIKLLLTNSTQPLLNSEVGLMTLQSKGDEATLSQQDSLEFLDLSLKQKFLKIWSNFILKGQQKHQIGIQTKGCHHRCFG